MTKTLPIIALVDRMGHTLLTVPSVSVKPTEQQQHLEALYRLHRTAVRATIGDDDYRLANGRAALVRSRAPT